MIAPLRASFEGYRTRVDNMRVTLATMFCAVLVGHGCASPPVDGDTVHIHFDRNGVSQDSPYGLFFAGRSEEVTAIHIAEYLTARGEDVAVTVTFDDGYEPRRWRTRRHLYATNFTRTLPLSSEGYRKHWKDTHPED